MITSTYDNPVANDLWRLANKLNTRAADLARKADLPYATAHKFLKGTMRRPTLETIEKIAGVFNFTLALMPKWIVP